MRQTPRIRRTLLAVLMLGAGFPPAASAQDGGPLLKSDLVRMMTASNYTTTEMAAIVRMNCVGFEPTARDRNQLATLPGSELVMVEVERCASRPRTTAAPAASEIPPIASKPAGEITLVDLAIAPVGQVVPELQAPRTATTLRTAEIPSLASRETRPKLRNWNEVTTAFLYEYRPRIRSSGTVILSLKVGSDGRVLEATVKESTGDQAMSDAALRVTEVMRFAPAMMRDQAVESLTELPIQFSTKN